MGLFGEQTIVTAASDSRAGAREGLDVVDEAGAPPAGLDSGTRTASPPRIVVMSA